MPKKRRVRCEVIKVPCNRKLSLNEPNFPPLKKLYLELIENKDKIKQDLINKEFKLSAEDEAHIKDAELHEIDNDYPVKYTNGISNGKTKGYPKIVSPDKSASKDSPSRDDEDIETKSPGEKSSPSMENGRTDYHEAEEEYNKEKPSRDQSNKDHNEDSDNEKDDLKDHIRSLFKDDKKSSKVSLRHASSSDEAPTLAELEKKGVYKNRYRNLNQDVEHNEAADDDMKRELKFKYDLLRKQYKGADIPELSIHTDYNVMRKKYETTLRTVALDRSVDQYKKYLTIGFALIEMSLTKFKFDMTDYTQHQITNMDSYETMLIEMSDKSYMPESTQWPVEIRLIILILINTASFIFLNMVSKSINLKGIGSVGTQQDAPVRSTSKRKMKGPDINLDDLPELNK